MIIWCQLEGIIGDTLAWSGMVYDGLFHGVSWMVSESLGWCSDSTKELLESTYFVGRINTHWPLRYEPMINTSLQTWQILLGSLRNSTTGTTQRWQEIHGQLHNKKWEYEQQKVATCGSDLFYWFRLVNLTVVTFTTVIKQLYQWVDHPSWQRAWAASCWDHQRPGGSSVAVTSAELNDVVQVVTAAMKLHSSVLLGCRATSRVGRCDGGRDQLAMIVVHPQRLVNVKPKNWWERVATAIVDKWPHHREK